MSGRGIVPTGGIAMREQYRVGKYLGVGLLIAYALIPAIAPTQSTVQMDYGVYLADYEIDLDRDGVADGLSVSGTWGNREQSLEAAGATFSIDNTRRFSGQRSQRVELNRNGGTSGTLTLRFDPIDNSARYIQAPVGTPVLVRFRLQAENLQNVTYRVRFRTGDRWGTIVSETSQSHLGWQEYSQVIPLEADASGNIFLRLYWEITLGEGSARGRLWLDGLEVLAQPLTTPARTRPNPIKMTQYVSGPRDWAEFTEVPLHSALVGFREHHALKTLYPSVQTMVYYHSNYAYARPDSWSRDLYDYYDVDANHPDWFLLDSNGNRIQDVRYPEQNAFYINPGHPQAQERAAQRLQLLVRDRGFIPDWVYLDGWNGRITSQQYPTWESILPAWLSLAQRLSPVIRNTLGAKMMVNSASQMGLYVDGNMGTQWINLIDGVLHEGAWIIYNGTTQQYTYRTYRSNRTPTDFRDSSWVTVLRAVQAYPDKYWVLLVQCDPNNNEMFRYAVASYLVVQHDRCLLAFDDRATMGFHTFLTFNLRPELFVPLGNATGAHRIEQGTINDGALFARDYQYGIVLVNPTENRTFTYRTPQTYKNWDGQILPADTTLTIPPRTGIVLYAAPEVVLSLTPQQVTALPGETVTFTVRFENRGLADAVNIELSVPLAEGLQFVGGNGVTFQNGQVKWSVSRLRPGEVGTRTFTARVQ
ncbi:MAG: putative glycoside hydrolase [Fimbriimonadales bacterium]